MAGSIARRPGLFSALVYTPIALAAAGTFILATRFTGDYSLVTRVGGAAWVFLLAMIILMPTVTPLIKRRLGEAPAGPARAGERSAQMSFLGSLFKKGTAVKDPVCGMEVDPAQSTWTSVHNGTAYTFCSKHCKEAFDTDPAQYGAGSHAGISHGAHTS